MTISKAREPSHVSYHVMILWILGLSIVLYICVEGIFRERVVTNDRMITLASSIQESGLNNNNQSVLFKATKSLSLCQNIIFPSTDFAIVSVNTANIQKNDGSYFAALALGNSIKTWTNTDLIFLTAQSENQSAYHDLELYGWMICNLVKTDSDLMEGKNPKFLKFYAWKLTEYRAVVLLDLDMLVLRSPMHLFTIFFPEMVAQSKAIGAVLVPDFKPSYSFLFCSQSNIFYPTITLNSTQLRKIQTELLLIIPSHKTFLYFTKRIQSNSSLVSFKALVRHYALSTPRTSNNLLYELPVEYNANVTWKICHPHTWQNLRVVVLHFTVVKPWTFMHETLNFFDFSSSWYCWAIGLNDECEQWRKSLHNTPKK